MHDKPNFKTRKFMLALFIAAIFILSAIFYAYFSHQSKGSASIPILYTPVEGPPEVSGWVPWWRESTGLSFINSFSDELYTVSPFCYFLEQEGFIKETCNDLNDADTIQKIKEKGLKVVPTLGSDMSKEELSALIADDKVAKDVSEKLAARLTSIQADGVDIDLEGITENHKDDFTEFLTIMSNTFRKHGFKFIVTVHAKTGKNDAQITKGQDLKAISEIADEVRVMIYDKHGTFSEPGAISPKQWFSEVIRYNLTVIPVEKIVIGLPSYGYIWEKSGYSKGYQFDEFNTYISQMQEDPSIRRDPLSSELVFSSSNYTGWLSDSETLISKIRLARTFGINRFSIWYLGGMDERFFDFDWDSIN